MLLFFLSRSPELLIFNMDDQEFLAILDYVLLCLLLQYNLCWTFLYCHIILACLIFSFFGYVFIKSINCILLSSFELKAILLITSVKSLCPSVINLCCSFNIIFFTNYFWNGLRLSMLIFIVSSKRFFITKSF